ncbi:MAG: hypothetical protein CMN55_03300 [Sneathiella sp.]|jgi:hypothetical protein|uniref:hypothetical protein n=1 Tax=Sneathiella sp. TaxID=1964365 RepID=UPI000C39CDB0|nr:hypothetical protein [Sneathiella sp.]MAL78132.1 hypothetical protein [Sneathiella sp.]
MTWRQVGSGEYENISFETREYKGEYLHIITPAGALTREDRLPVYQATLDLTRSDSYLCLLDNRKGQELSLTGEDIVYFADILADHGIRRVIYAVVTNDPGYGNIIKLIRAIAETKNIAMHAMSTTKFDEAEEFFLAEIEKLAAEQ